MPYPCWFQWVGYNGVICQQGESNKHNKDKHSIFFSPADRRQRERWSSWAPCSFLPATHSLLVHILGIGHVIMDNPTDKVAIALSALQLFARRR